MVMEQLCLEGLCLVCSNILDFISSVRGRCWVFKEGFKQCFKEEASHYVLQKEASSLQNDSEIENLE